MSEYSRENAPKSFTAAASVAISISKRIKALNNNTEEDNE